MMPTLESAAWRRSSLCMNAGCVEVGAIEGLVVVRDSKLESSPVLSYTPDEWQAFIAGVKAGEFDFLGAPA
jgi:Domain of unknown function (DUF397)